MSIQSSKVTLSIGSIGMLLLTAYLLFPYCQYYLDPDATAYLQMVDNAIQGDMQATVNSLWSPFHAWISIGLHQLYPMSTSVTLLVGNLLGASLVVILSNMLLQKFITNRFQLIVFALFQGVFWGSNAYIQLTSDVWGVFFALLIFYIFLLNNRFESKKYNVLLGVLIAISALAKTYTMYIFTLFFLIILTYRWYKKSINFKQAVGILLAIYLPLLLVLMPWIYLFHEKFGAWTISWVGKYNMSTRVATVQIVKEKYHHFFPPATPQSLTFWQDPSFLYTNWVSVFDSPKTFLKFGARIGQNIAEWASAVGHLSFLYGATWAYAVWSLFFPKQSDDKSKAMNFVYLWVAIFPVGLLLVHIEARYMWATVPFALIIIFQILNQLHFYGWSKLLSKVAVVVIVGSYILGPVLDLKTIINVGKSDYELAQKIKSLGIKGSFFANKDYDSGFHPSLQRIAYFLQDPVYLTSKDTFTFEAKLATAQEMNIDYYYYFFDEHKLENADAVAELMSFPEVTEGRIPNVRIFQLKP